MMKPRRSLLMLIVLVLAMVIPMSGSADRGPTKETPVPITATPIPTSVVAKATPIPGILERLGYNDVPDPQEMEGFRRELLDVVDSLDVLSDKAPHRPGHLSHAHSSLEKARKGIQELTDEELYMIQSSFKASGMDFQVVKANVEHVKSLVLTPGKGISEKDQFPTTSSLTAEGSGGKGQGPGPSLSSFPSIPTPTPVATPTPPAIPHQNHEQTNEVAGDLCCKCPDDAHPSCKENQPAWPTDIKCPAKGYSTELMFGLMVSLDVLKAGHVILQAICDEKTVLGTNPQDPVQCLIKSILDYVIYAVQEVYDLFAFCIGNSNSARIQAIYEDTKIIHADLAMHDANLHTRFNMTDQFLFDFRNLNLRLNIEANLASPDDDPHALLALPRSVCTSPELEMLQWMDPFAPEVIAGCGLLEVVSDTVRSAMDMTINAGEGVNNAEAEFAAAVAHYGSGEWKLAYARFRKAYRETVRP